LLEEKIMTTFPEYEQYDGLGLAELVCNGEVSPLELVEAAIERIEARNPQVNAVIHKMYEEAKQVAQETAVRNRNAPFAGVPFLLKDLLAEYGGTPLRNGSRILPKLRFFSKMGRWCSGTKQPV
jgi:amidase